MGFEGVAVHRIAALAGALDPVLVGPVDYDTVDAIEADAAAFIGVCRDRGLAVELDE